MGAVCKHILENMLLYCFDQHSDTICLNSCLGIVLGSCCKTIMETSFFSAISVSDSPFSILSVSPRNVAKHHYLHAIRRSRIILCESVHESVHDSVRESVPESVALAGAPFITCVSQLFESIYGRGWLGWGWGGSWEASGRCCWPLQRLAAVLLLMEGFWWALGKCIVAVVGLCNALLLLLFLHF